MKAALTGDADAKHAYKRNPERVLALASKAQYGLSQLSTFDLWSMTGLMGSEMSVAARQSPVRKLYSY